MKLLKLLKLLNSKIEIFVRKRQVAIIRLDPASRHGSTGPTNSAQVIRRPEGDHAVKQFARRFLEMRAAEQFKMQTVKR